MCRINQELLFLSTLEAIFILRTLCLGIWDLFCRLRMALEIHHIDQENRLEARHFLPLLAHFLILLVKVYLDQIDSIPHSKNRLAVS